MGNQLGIDLSGALNTIDTYMGDELDATLAKFGEQMGVTGEALAAYIQTFFTIVNAALSAKPLDKQTKSNAGTGALVGAGAGAVIGGIIGSAAGPLGTAVGALLGSQLGQIGGQLIGGMIKWGPQNGETKSRHVFANWLEDQLSKLDAATFINRNGQFTTARGSMMNFIEGDTSRFNDPNWAQSMAGWGKDAVNTFTALGNALKETLGITDRVGQQIGFLLGENLAGNIDNARLLVYELGLSFEDLSQALLNMAKQGEITWGEYVSQVAGLGEAFKPGLSAMGNLKGAVDELIGSGGRGMAALKAIKDIAQEGLEQGAHTLDELQQRLVASGIDPAQAQAIIASMKEQGVRTVQEIANLSEAQTGAIVAGIGARSKEISDKWQEIGNNLEKIKWNLDQLPTSKDIKINISAELDSNMKKVIDSGIVGGAGLNNVDVESPTVSTRSVSQSQVKSAAIRGNNMSGKVSANSFNISIDARGADSGVEQRIHDVVNSYREVIANDAANMVYSNQVRGA